MTPDVPLQRRHCSVHAWCIGHTGPGDVEHHGSARVVHAQGGRELRLALTSVGDGPVRVGIEVLLSAGGPPLEVVELDPVEVLEAAAALRGLAMDSREPVEY